MYRKCLRNNNKSKRTNGIKENKIGTPLGIKDKNNNDLYVGDDIAYGEYEGKLMYNASYRKYGVFLSYSMWYGDNAYNPDSYGKFIPIPLDNGAKNELKKINA